MHQHSTNDETEPCSHSCSEVKSLVYADLQLLKSIEDLQGAQHGLDPTTWSLSQVITYYQAFVEYHPTMTVETLLGGIGVHTEALKARVRWERNE